MSAPVVDHVVIWLARKMSLSTLKKRKVDSENRQLNSEWTEKYLFISVCMRPVCLLCNESISVCKEYNLKRHFKTTHANFDTAFPLGSDARRQKILGPLRVMNIDVAPCFRRVQSKREPHRHRCEWHGYWAKRKCRLLARRLSRSACLRQSRS